MIKVSGIIIAASQVRSRATTFTLQCRNCRHIIADKKVEPGLDGFALPRKCEGLVSHFAVLTFENKTIEIIIYGRLRIFQNSSRHNAALSA